MASHSLLTRVRALRQISTRAEIICRSPSSSNIARVSMNADERAVCEFLKAYPGTYVSVMEISRRLGVRRQFKKDRAWARPILRRMELDNVLESNQSIEPTRAHIRGCI